MRLVMLTMLCVSIAITGMVTLAGTTNARTQIGTFKDLDAPPTVTAYATAVSGTIVPAGEMVLDGRKLLCGRRPTVLDARLDDYAAAFPGFIIINPRLIARVSTSVKLWIYAHECGHQFRGPDEATADCFAVQRGRRQGWLTTDGLDEVCRFIEPARGSIMHPPGPERCRLMRICFSEQRVR
ncbi:MAG: hypothetical protein AAF732_21035 [Pseudomonadota bacterium]